MTGYNSEWQLHPLNLLSISAGQMSHQSGGVSRDRPALGRNVHSKRARADYLGFRCCRRHVAALRAHQHLKQKRYKVGEQSWEACNQYPPAPFPSEGCPLT